MDVRTGATTATTRNTVTAASLFRMGAATKGNGRMAGSTASAFTWLEVVASGRASGMMANEYTGSRMRTVMPVQKMDSMGTHILAALPLHAPQMSLHLLIGAMSVLL